MKTRFKIGDRVVWWEDYTTKNKGTITGFGSFEDKDYVEVTRPLQAGAFDRMKYQLPLSWLRKLKPKRRGRYVTPPNNVYLPWDGGQITCPVCRFRFHKGEGMK